MYILIIIFPLLGFLGTSLFGRLFGKGSCIITSLFTGFSFLLSCNLFLNIEYTNNIYLIKIIEWVYSDNLKIDWCFYFDSLSTIMLIVVTFISTLVHIYSIEYMKEDPHLVRFMSYLSLFTFFMIILVTANNFLQLFVGWEGVGVSSYLLINFWFTRIQANKSAIKAMLVNRVGDFFLLLAIFSIFFIINSLDFDIVFSMIPYIKNINLQIISYNVPIVDVIGLFLFLGAMGKSAQVGLHTWLPDAMEGPTPVSALIHAATMVTAGVFLIIRCSYIFENAPNILKFMAVVGSMTAFFAATTGLFQNDIKKIIAYSTCSQLGYMIFVCGLSGYEVSIFHLSNHAFFKALLFLGSGSIIHALSDEQDIRRMGGLKNILPFSYTVTLIGSMALMGIPFLSGFYSKDVILEIAISKYSSIGYFCFLFGIFAAFFTAFYSVRLIYLVFLTRPNGIKKSILNAHESSKFMYIPLILLCIMSIFIGFFSRDLFIGLGNSFWSASIFIYPINYNNIDSEFIFTYYKLLPLVLVLLATVVAYSIYRYKIVEFFYIKKLPNYVKFYTFFNKKWYFDRIFNECITQNILQLSYYFTYNSVDRGLLEKIGPYGSVNLLLSFFKKIKFIQGGIIFTYLLYFILFILFFIFVIYIIN
jgi:NADH-ubiquinone oxidoreductase chain 5